MQEAARQAVGAIVASLESMHDGAAPPLGVVGMLCNDAQLQQTWTGTMVANRIAFTHLCQVGCIDAHDAVTFVLIASELQRSVNRPGFDEQAYPDAVALCERMAEGIGSAQAVSLNIFHGDQKRTVLAGMVLLWILVHALAVQHSMTPVDAGRHLSLDIARR
jgi:hypothetical protein